MINTALRILLFSLLACMHVYAQVPAKKSTKLFFEKVYVHTDRNAYMAGDTLWFKAYLVNAQNNIPVATSGTLYTELISADAQIIDSHIIKLTDGFGHGDYQLPDSLASGKYYLRAYTSWMRNFGNEFVFFKEINIIQNKVEANKPTIQPALKTSKLSAIKPVTVPSQPTVRFYPEGGALVNNLVSMVAVKAENARGRGHAIMGAVISSSGDTAARFRCDSLGMGIFPFLPLSGVSYHAMVGNTSYVFPVAVSGGLALKVTQADGMMAVSIQKADTISAKATISIKHAGAIIVNHPLKIAKLTTINFVTTDFPEGISLVTLYDEQGRPQCERLVYIHHHNASAVLVNTIKQDYNAGEEVAVKVTGPINSNLSMAVVDAGLSSMGENIVSYLMLRSEIKGRIENPDSYFDTTNANRFKQLDLLLMTQGWRDFLWRRLADTVIATNYPAETGIAVKGFIEDEITKKRLARLNVSLYANGAKGQKLFSEITDTEGKFAFTNVQLYGMQNVVLASVNNMGKKKGSFMMDTLSVPVELKGETDTINTVKGWAELEHAYEQRESIAKDIGIKKVVKLDAVKVTAKRKVYMSRSGTTYMPWGPKPQSFTITAQDEKFKTLEWYILQNALGARSNGAHSGVIFGKIGSPVLFVNGEEPNPNEREFFDDLYFNMPITKFKSIKIEYVIGALNDEKVFMYLELKDKAMTDNPGSLNLKVNGYYDARTFYQPSKQNELSAAELNPTLYWQPYVKTDDSGVAIVKFKSGHIPSKYIIVIQGISEAGSPVSGIGNFEVR